VHVPGGEYDFGEIGERFAAPTRRVRVSAFYVDAHEVTVERFRRWLMEAGDPPPLPASVVYPNGTSVALMPASYAAPAATSTFHGSDPLLPITGVRPSTAQGFCVWDGGRLPTEAEWEWLAAGRPVTGLGSERHFPWGSSAPTCSLANSNGCGGAPRAVTASTSPVGGVHDLAGNVFEWTIDGFEDLALFGGADAAVADAGMPCWPTGALLVDPVCQNTTGTSTRRGGSHSTASAELGSAYRYFFTVFSLDAQTGFRCVYPAR
jgi:sulfatase modifying factor 1